MALPDTTVKYFDSAMSGAPQLTGETGKLVAILDACLQDGFGSVTLSSLTIASNVATGYVAGGHGFAMIGGAGPVIRVAGATPSGLNADWRIASVADSTHFTFATEGISDQTATGTITASRAPLGFTKAYTGTNKGVYRPDDVASTRFYLRVVDDGTGSATYARVVAYESMSDVDTGTNAFPTAAQLSGGGYIIKSSTANNTPRAWMLVGDSRLFTFFSTSDGTKLNPWSYGDPVSVKSGDAYHATLWANNASSPENAGVGYLAASTARIATARGQAQTGTAILPIQYCHTQHSAGYTAGSMTYPNPADSSLAIARIELWDSTSSHRGIVPGMYGSLHAASAIADGTIVTNFSGLGGRSVIVKKINIGGSGNNAAMAFDLTGPWR